MNEAMTTTDDDRTSDAGMETVPALPPLTEQAERLIATGALEGDGSKVTVDEFRDVTADLEHRSAAGALLVV